MLPLSPNISPYSSFCTFFCSQKSLDPPTFQLVIIISPHVTVIIFHTLDEPDSFSQLGRDRLPLYEVVLAWDVFFRDLYGGWDGCSF